MSVRSWKARQFTAFPSSLQGALQVVPYLQVLIYLPFLLQGFELTAFMLTVGGHLLLYPLFFKVFWHKGYGAAPFVLVMAVLAFVISAYSLSGVVFFAFAAASCAACRNRSQTLWLLFVVNCVYLLSAYVFVHSFYVILVALFFTAVNGVSFDFQLRKYLADRLIKQSQEEVSALATVAERERIARDLHDLLGHSLTSIALKAELAERLLGRDPQSAKQHLREVQEVSRRALSQVRDAVADYKTNTFDNEWSNTRIALESVDIELTSFIANVDIPASVDAALAMILREATTNLLRHSRATRCKVSLQLRQGCLVLEVSDNGKTMIEPSPGNGLKGMEERCRALGGDLKASFQPGCKIAASIPLANSSEGGQ